MPGLKTQVCAAYGIVSRRWPPTHRGERCGRHGRQPTEQRSGGHARSTCHGGRRAAPCSTAQHSTVQRATAQRARHGTAYLHDVHVNDLQLVLVGRALHQTPTHQGWQAAVKCRRRAAAGAAAALSAPPACACSQTRCHPLSPEPRRLCSAQQHRSAAAASPPRSGSATACSAPLPPQPTCTRRVSSRTIRGSSSTAITCREAGRQADLRV